MLVLFQTFLMMARSPRWPARVTWATDRPGQQHSDGATSCSADGGWLFPVAAAALGTDFGWRGDDCCALGQPSLRSRLSCTWASSTQTG